MAKGNQRAGWRKSKTGAVAAIPTEIGHQGRERRKLLFRVSMLSTLAIVLVVLLLIFFLRPTERDVPLILAVVSESRGRTNNEALFTAPNPYALEDCDLLHAWFDGGEGQPSENVLFQGGANGVMNGEKLIAALTKPLATVPPGGPNGDMIAIYLSAHGFVDRGQPFLAVGDSQADNQQSWVSYQALLQQIVATLNKRTDGGQDSRVLIFIDAARVGPQWDWGQFSESFAVGCEQVSLPFSERIAVILSASPGERSWWDPGQGQGLFAQALVAALTGQGDAYRDRRVTIGEIAEHIQKQVRQSAAATWNATQTPMLVGTAAADWQMISQPRPMPAPELPPVDSKQLAIDFESIDLLWERHNQLAVSRHPPLAFDPLGWATLEKKLARLDAFLLSGKGYRDAFQSLRSSCESDLTRFESGPATMPKEASLPELALRDYFYGANHESSDFSPDETAAFQEMVNNWTTKPDIDAAVQVKLNEAQAIRFLTDWIDKKGFDRNAIELATDLLDRANLVTDNQSASLLESHLIRLISAPDLRHLDPQTIAMILDSQSKSRSALCTDDLRASFWIRSSLHRLEQQRLDCVDRMLSRDPDEQAIGRDQWRRDIRPGFAAIAEEATAISRAYRLRDEMLHAIPRIAETLLSDPDAFANQEQLPDAQSRVLMQRSVEKLSQLISSLQLPQNDDPRVVEPLQARIAQSEREASEAFQAFQNRLGERLKHATDTKARDAEKLRQNSALLNGSGTHRAELRRRLHETVVKLIADSNAAVGNVLNAQTPTASNSQVNRSELMSVGNRHLWTYWLSVSDSNVASQNAVASIVSGDETGSRNDLDQQFQDSGALFREWVAEMSSGKLDEQTIANDVMQDPIDRADQNQSIEQTRRLIERWDTHLRARTVLLSHAPPAIDQIGKGRFELDQQLFLFDHASRTMDEFWCEARLGEPPFFVAATNRLLSSRDFNPPFSRIALNLNGMDLGHRIANATESVDANRTLKPEPAEVFRDGPLLKFVKGNEVEFVLDRPAVIPTGYVSVWSVLGSQAKVVSLAAESNQAISISLSVPEDVAANQSAIDAEAFYRGLRRSGRILFKNPTGGITTVFNLPSYSKPAVRVIRQQKEPERFLLVMDCSGSMSSTDMGQSRLDIAKSAVTEFLDRLGSDVEVGLLLFGDQFGFKESLINPNKGKPNPDNRPQIWPVVIGGVEKLPVQQLLQGRVIDAGFIVGNEDVAYNPNFDVRVGTPIKPLEIQQRADIKRQILQLGPIGTTPTYRAIVKAYEQLGNRRGHIIVLTDGEPNVIHAKGIVVPDMAQLARNKFQQNQGNIKLTFVRYLISAKQLEKEFVGAQFLDAPDGATLIRHLRDIRSKPEVVWERNREPASDRGDFESLVSVSQWPPAGATGSADQPVIPAELFSIRTLVPDSLKPIDQLADVRVEGGEQFELLLNENELGHKPFEYQYTPLQSLATQLADGNRFQVRAGPKSKRENRQLSIQLAIESANGARGNGKFTPRPSDIWVELAGINSRSASRGRNEVYSFSMPEFLMRQPIPILLCNIEDFGSNYDKVEVKAWMRFGAKSLVGSEIAIDSNQRITVESLPGVTFYCQRSKNDGNGIRLTVTEQYAGELQPGSLCVMTTPLPNRSSTVSYRDKVVERTFEFDRDDMEIRLRAVRSDEIQQSSSLYAEGTIDLDFDSR